MVHQQKAASPADSGWETLLTLQAHGIHDSIAAGHLDRSRGQWPLLPPDGGRVDRCIVAAISGQLGWFGLLATDSPLLSHSSGSGAQSAPQ